MLSSQDTLTCHQQILIFHSEAAGAIVSTLCPNPGPHAPSDCSGGYLPVKLILFLIYKGFR